MRPSSAAATIEGSDKVTKKREGKRSSDLTVVRLESQDDIGYVTGRRQPDEKEKQVRSPAPRRQRGGDSTQEKGAGEG